MLRFGPDLACLEWLMKCGSTGVLISDNILITSQRQMRQYLSRLGCDTSAKQMVRRLIGTNHLTNHPLPD